ncbi:MAG: hypothetical protein JSV92_01065 [archaeon]|nr:MAG: hypothetical protein JSV92_01065 [archaeon]
MKKTIDKGIMGPLLAVAVCVFVVVFCLVLMLLVQLGKGFIEYKIIAEAEDPSIAEMAMNSLLEQETDILPDSNEMQNLLSLYNNTHDAEMSDYIQNLINSLFVGENLNLSISGENFHNGIKGTHSATSFGKVALPGESYVEQENATQTWKGPGALEIVYEKPIGVKGADWVVRHGNLVEYRITIPDSCWNAYPGTLYLRIESSLDRFGGTAYSRPFCRNGADWVPVGHEVNLVGGTNCQNRTEGSYTYDGSWYSYAALDSEGDEWYWCDENDPAEMDGIGAAIYEEKILWLAGGSREKIYLRYYRK